MSQETLMSQIRVQNKRLGELEKEIQDLKTTISKYSAGWEKMQEALEKLACPCEDNACAWNNGVKEILSLKQPSVAKAGDEPQSNREDLK